MYHLIQHKDVKPALVTVFVSIHKNHNTRFYLLSKYIYCSAQNTLCKYPCWGNFKTAWEIGAFCREFRRNFSHRVCTLVDMIFRCSDKHTKHTFDRNHLHPECNLLRAGELQLDFLRLLSVSIWSTKHIEVRSQLRDADMKCNSLTIFFFTRTGMQHCATNLEMNRQTRPFLLFSRSFK